VTGTLVATWMGTGSLFGNAEFAVKNGVSAFLLPVASAVGIVVLTFLAPRARSWSSGCSWRSRWCTATRVKPRSCCRKPCVGPWGGKNAVFWIGVMLPGFLLILGDANLHQRFLSARDPATARRSAIGMFFGVLAVDWMIIGLALLWKLLLWQQILGAPWNELEPVIPALAANVLAMITTSVWVARPTER